LLRTGTPADKAVAIEILAGLTGRTDRPHRPAAPTGCAGCWPTSTPIPPWTAPTR
jgi:hypothetical protein